MLLKKEIPSIEHNVSHFLIDYKWWSILRDIDIGFDNGVYKKLASIPEKNGRSILILYAYLVHIPVKTISLNFCLSQTRIRAIIKSLFIAINKCLKKPLDIDLTFLEKENKLLDCKDIFLSKKITLHFKAKTELLAVITMLLNSVDICCCRKEANMFYQLNLISKKNILLNNVSPSIEKNIFTKNLYTERETYDQFIIEINESIKFEKR